MKKILLFLMAICMSVAISAQDKIERTFNYIFRIENTVKNVKRNREYIRSLSPVQYSDRGTRRVQYPQNIIHRLDCGDITFRNFGDRVDVYRHFPKETRRILVIPKSVNKTYNITNISMGDGGVYTVSIVVLGGYCDYYLKVGERVLESHRLY